MDSSSDDYSEAQKEARRQNPHLPNYPDVEGTLEISLERGQVFILGDPDGLRSLAKMLEVLAGVNQELMDTPYGAREHIHLSPPVQLSGSSVPAQLCRLDASGSGEFPDRYKKKRDKKR